MKLITTTDKRRLPDRTPTADRSINCRTHLGARLRRAQIWSEATEKYQAAVEIYRTGGCRLKEIERAYIELWRGCQRPTMANQAERPWRDPAGEPSMTSAAFRINAEYWTARHRLSISAASTMCARNWQRAAAVHCDEQDTSRIEDEISAIRLEPRRTIGVGGRQRLAADFAERARVKHNYEPSHQCVPERPALNSRRWLRLFVLIEQIVRSKRTPTR